MGNGRFQPKFGSLRKIQQEQKETVFGQIVQKVTAVSRQKSVVNAPA
jgi:hypothetical protein